MALRCEQPLAERAQPCLAGVDGEDLLPPSTSCAALRETVTPPRRFAPRWPCLLARPGPRRPTSGRAAGVGSGLDQVKCEVGQAAPFAFKGVAKALDEVERAGDVVGAERVASPALLS